VEYYGRIKEGAVKGRGKVRKNITLLCLLALFLVLVGGCAHEAAPPPPQARELPHAPLYHWVERGETLWEIGKIYGVSPEALMRINNISDPTELRVGQLLQIPAEARRPRAVRQAPRWTHIVIHHSATEVGNAETFDREHLRRGFRHGLAYHFVISNGTSGRRDGQIEVSRRWEKQIDSACTRNRKRGQGATISICLVGNFNHQFVSSRQFASLVWLIKELQRHYNIPVENIITHRDVDVTDCPGRNFPSGRLERELRRR
jgi:LysM repeat protein